MVPNCFPCRPYLPFQIALLRIAIKNGWLRAEDYPDAAKKDVADVWKQLLDSGLIEREKEAT